MKKLILVAIGAVVLFGLPVPEHVQSAPPAGVVSVEKPSKLDELLHVVSTPKACARGWDGPRLPIGTISASTTSANITNLPDRAYIIIQCPVAFYAGSAGSRSNAVCTTTTCPYYDANEKAYFDLAPGFLSLAVILPSGTATCSVFQVP